MQGFNMAFHLLKWLKVHFLPKTTSSKALSRWQEPKQQILASYISPSLKFNESGFKKKKREDFYFSKLLTDWETNAICSLYTFLIFICSAEVSSFKSVKIFVQSQIWISVIWWTRYKTEINQCTDFKKFVVQCVLLYLSYPLMCNL